MLLDLVPNLANDASTTTPKSLVLRARMSCHPMGYTACLYFVLEMQRAVFSEPKPIIPSKSDGSPAHHQEPALSVMRGSSRVDMSNQETMLTYSTQVGHKRSHGEMDSNADIDKDQGGVNNNRGSEMQKEEKEQAEGDRGIKFTTCINYLWGPATAYGVNHLVTATCVQKSSDLQCTTSPCALHVD
jgi:hypothetical protein